MKDCRFHAGALAVALFAALTISESVSAEDRAESPWNAKGSPGLGALAAAADAGRFTYVLFWRDNDEATQRMNAVLQQAPSQLKSDVATLSIRVSDPREVEAVEIFGVDRAPLPLIAAVAPNGAVTKAWPLKATPEQLADGLVSRGAAACLKAMQEQKLSLICVLNQQTAHSAAVRLAASGFQADERFAAATRIIEIDPADASERTFLTSLKISPKTPDAVAVLVSPTGQPVGMFSGAVTTAEIVAKLKTAQQGCCPGGKCGPGGCCPGGQCGPQKK
jgi:hypothetical protein